MHSKEDGSKFGLESLEIVSAATKSVTANCITRSYNVDVGRATRNVTIGESKMLMEDMAKVGCGCLL
jgi:hypothetical protein